MRRAARGLQDRGLKPGDRIGLCLPNTPYYPILYFAALRIGAVIVNLNPLYVERELRHLIEDSGATFVAVPDLRMIHEKVAGIAAETGITTIIVCPMADILPWPQALGFRLFKRADHARVPADARHVSYRDIVAVDGDPRPVPQNPNDLAVLQYTGGTTGIPKGAMLTHGERWWPTALQVVGPHRWAGTAEQERMLARAAAVPRVRA